MWSGMALGDFYFTHWTKVVVSPLRKWGNTHWGGEERYDNMATKQVGCIEIPWGWFT